MPSYTVETIPRVTALPAAEWDACAGAANPFLSHAFLSALEESRSVEPKAGWAPSHLVVREGGRVVGVAPAYLKGHSWGEYVFDQAWADGYRRAGLAYYPKLLVGVPFTPVPGPRLLTADPVVRRVLVDALRAVVAERKLSSAHVNFVEPDDLAALTEAGWLPRMGMQFHWTNHGYTSFEDFLAALTSHRRKELRRERRQVAASGVAVEAVPGSALTASDWDRFHELYLEQSEKKWGQPYLTREFFERIGATLGDRVLLVVGRAEGEIVAGALNLVGTEALYGRNWGASVQVPGLHFEVCYHQAVEWAITHGLARVEAGAQGEHKLQRGYLPVPTWSAHWIADERFRRAIGDWLVRERDAVEGSIAEYALHSPFRQPGG